MGRTASVPTSADRPALPVREVAIYKDGHAFVLHQGRSPVSDGAVVLERLPAPVLGTVWAFSVDPGVKLASVVAGPRFVDVQRTATSLIDLVIANPGAEVSLTEDGRDAPYAATIIGVPERDLAELRATDPPGTDPRPPVRAEFVQLRTSEGIRIVRLDKIRDVTFRDAPQPLWTNTELRNALALRLDWGGRPPAAEAEIGLTYVQRGIRWIPSYRVNIDGQGKATVQLQASLINEMVDLEDVTAHLVIGMPSFMFAHTLDPLALQDTLAQLSQYFQQPGQAGGQVAAFSNALQAQAARMGEYHGGGPGDSAAPASADLAGERHENLFIFTLPHVTLRKGERMLVPVAEFTIDYSDVFTLDLPIAPTADLQPNLGGDQQAELARLLAAPKAMHQLRMKNNSTYPLTTAPALILRDGRVLGQGLMTYTSVGGNSDLEVTAAVDIQVNSEERETGRTPNAIKINNDNYSRVDLEGTLHLCNHRAQAGEIEVTRYVLGHPDQVSHDGKSEKVQLQDVDRRQPHAYWQWYNWPHWWAAQNGFARFSWRLKLEPGQAVDLTYKWHYFWR